MRYYLSEIASITGGQLLGEDRLVESVIFDSRVSLPQRGALFVALMGVRDGHDYIEDASSKGIRAYLISSDEAFDQKMGSAVVVENTLEALQTVAREYRKELRGEVTAIVGSNGKSIVKEWIWQISDHIIYRSPRSYNSQLGVALSLLAAPTDAKDVVIEAGISTLGEMETLERMVSPDRVIITNIGAPHDSGFDSREQKLSEKLIMARSARSIIFPASDSMIEEALRDFNCEKLSFGVGCGDVAVERTDRGVSLSYSSQRASEKCRYMPDIALVNSAAAAAFFINRGVNNSVDNFVDIFSIASKIGGLQGVAMRLELRSGRDGGVVINDSYSSDVDSLLVALDYLGVVADGRERVVILSDISSSSMDDCELYGRVAEMVQRASVSRLIGVGERISSYGHLFGRDARFYSSVEELLTVITAERLDRAAVLIKGSRSFGMERLSLALEQQLHSTVLEVNLERMATNLSYYRSHLDPKVKMMAMVKAFSYGMGGEGEIAMRLQREGVDYLAVAYADEGVELRKRGVSMPIVVLNSDPSGYRAMVENHLEPEIYSIHSLSCFAAEVSRFGMSGYPIHIKVDSGMHRLGFRDGDLEELLEYLKGSSAVRVASIFSHLAASEDPGEEQFTREQIRNFRAAAGKIESGLGRDDILKHICNSAAIVNYPSAHMDMVRLGVGLYQGRDGQEVARLKSVVVDIKEIAEGESVSYNRRYRASSPRRIAIVAIGYADGLDRRLSCGEWSYTINGQLCPIVGSICMDVSMVDVTDAGDVAPGDMVEIFGDGNSADMMASKLGTINYEIFTSISRRVKRIFIKE